MAQCVQCSTAPVAEEFQRCQPCNAVHQELVKKLDARPKVNNKPPKEVLIPIVTKKKINTLEGMKEIDFTTFYTKEELKFWNIPVPQDYA